MSPCSLYYSQYLFCCWGIGRQTKLLWMPRKWCKALLHNLGCSGSFYERHCSIQIKIYDWNNAWQMLVVLVYYSSTPVELLRILCIYAGIDVTHLVLLIYTVVLSPNIVCQLILWILYLLSHIQSSLQTLNLIKK